MKRQSGSRIGTLLKNIFNVRTWADWDRVKAFTSYLWEGLKHFFVPPPHHDRAAAQSFEDIQAQFHLTDAQLMAKQKALFRLCFLMLLFAVLLLSYTIYLFILGHLMAGILSFVVTFIALVLAFRYHFWYFQIKERILGCSIRDWFRRGIMGDKP